MRSCGCWWKLLLIKRWRYISNSNKSSKSHHLRSVSQHRSLVIRYVHSYSWYVCISSLLHHTYSICYICIYKLWCTMYARTADALVPIMWLLNDRSSSRTGIWNERIYGFRQSWKFLTPSVPNIARQQMYVYMALIRMIERVLALSRMPYSCDRSRWWSPRYTI